MIALHGKSDNDFDNFDILRKLCNSINSSEFGMIIPSDVSIKSMFVEPSFTDNRCMQDIVDCLNSRRGVFITSETTGAGCSMITKTMIMSCILHRDGEDFSWSGIRNPVKDNPLIFLMRIRDISVQGNADADWIDYIEWNITEMQRIEKISLNKREIRAAFLAYIDNEAKKRKVIFFIDGPEKFESSDGVTSADRRKFFFTALDGYLQSRPNVKFFCATTDRCYEEISAVDYSDCISDHDRFGILHPDEDFIHSFIEKWGKLSDNRLLRPEQLENAVNSNADIKDIVSETPRSLMFYLVAASLEGQPIDRVSQTHFMEIISKKAVRDAIQGRCNRYDFVIPLSVVALWCCINGKHSVSRNEITAVWNSNKILMDAYITEDANEDMFISLLGKFAFVQNYRNQYGQTEFSFSQIWLANYAANAIARGLVGSVEDKYDKRVSYFLNAKLNEFHENSVDDRMAQLWISIIATASKLTKENADTFVSILINQAKDFSPRHRKVREIAVIALLKIMRNGAFMFGNHRKSVLYSSLSFYLYHQQIDDLKAIISRSTHRKTLLREIFRNFEESILSTPPCPIPVFHFSVGFLTINYVDIENWDGKIETLNEEILLNSESRRNFFDKNVNAMLRFYRVRYADLSITGRIVFALMVNSMTWIILGKSIHLGQINYIPSSGSVDMIDAYTETALELLGSEDYRISNAAGYALSHIIASDAQAGQRFSDEKMIKDVLYADYRARIAYSEYRDREKRVYGEDIQSYCGALRTLTLLEPDISMYGICSDDLKLKVLYYQVWDEYCSRIRDNEECIQSPEYDNARRYLMLIFKAAFLSGAFGPTVDYCKKSIAALWRLKFPDYSISAQNYPGTAVQRNTVGLVYDREDSFFRYIYRLYNEMH